MTSLHDARPGSTNTRSTGSTCVPAWPSRWMPSWSRSARCSTASARTSPRSPRPSPSSSTAASGCGRPSATGAGAAAGGDDCDEIMAAAASLELLQACALVHDDVMDGSDTRRGAPSRPPQVRRAAPREGWRGDPESFGVAAAILLGDLLLVWSEQMLATSGLDEAALLRAQPVYDRMRVELMAGQYLDVVEQAWAASTSSARCGSPGFKSAKYTDRAPAAPRRRARRRLARPSSTRTQRVRAAARRGLPAARRRAGRVRRPRPRPASRPATTCARASAPCWSRRRCPVRTRARRPS